MAGQAAAEPRDQDDDVETEPHAGDDVGRNVSRERAPRHVQGDPLAEAVEERAIDRVTHARGGGTREHQLAHEDARELGLRCVEREERTEHVLGLVGDRGALGQRLEGAADGVREAVLEHERDQVFLARGVEEQRSLGDACALGDGRRRRRVEPALDEERGRRLADPGALVLLVLFATHRF